MYRKYYIIRICFLTCWLLPGLLFAQQERHVEYSKIDQLVDDLLLEDEQLDETSINDLYEALLYYQEKPANVNKLDRDFFSITKLLSPEQINAFFRYKEEFGAFIALEELQAVAGFDQSTIDRLLPFVKITNDKDYQLSIPKMMISGKSTLYLKWQSVLEDQVGYDAERTNAYLGSKDKLTLRYRYTYENRLRFGLLAEKDAGEEFFSGSNKNGFDYYSAYLHLKDYKHWLKDVLIGDYTMSIGQGLVMHNDFGTGKSSFITDIKKGGRTIRSYSSLAENNNLRGLAATVKLFDKLEVTPYFSMLKKDGSVQSDTLENEDFFNGVLQSGNHRTENELLKKNQVEELASGLYVKYKTDKFQFGAYSSYFRYDSEIRRNDQLYNKFRITGNEQLYLGVDGSIRLRNVNLFGEFSRSKDDALAYLAGALIAINPRTSLIMLYRNYDREFPVLYSNAFGESSEASNEKGFYTGIKLKISDNWTFSSYADLWKFPWLKFQIDKPSTGYEFLSRLDYRVKRKFSFYIQYFHEKKEQNYNLNPATITTVENRYRNNLRLHFNYNINKDLQFRNRIEFSFYKHGDISEKGFLMYQDIAYKPIGKDLSLSARYSIFDTDGFNSRIYTYENDILYEFFIPSFANRGSRAYINLRYNLTYDLMIEGRYERTFIHNAESIGSGLEEIQGDIKSRVKAQVKMKF